MTLVMLVMGAIMLAVGWLVARSEEKELEQYEHHR